MGSEEIRWMIRNWKKGWWHVKNKINHRIYVKTNRRGKPVLTRSRYKNGNIKDKYAIIIEPYQRVVCNMDVMK